MVKVMACDDDSYMGEWFNLALEKYANLRGVEFEFKSFTHMSDMLKSIGDGAKPDLICLDIMLPEGNGISLIQQVRDRIVSSKLVLITSSDDFALQGYAVHAYDYLIKPLNEASFFALLDTICKPQNTQISIRVKGLPVTINSADLLYIESNKHSLAFHMQKIEFVTYGKLDDYAELLKPDNSFVRCHQSYLINMNHIADAKSRFFLMKDGVQIPIRKKDAAEFKRGYYAFIMNCQENDAAAQCKKPQLVQ